MDYNYNRIMEKFNRNSIPGKVSYKLDNNTYAIKSGIQVLIKFHDSIIGILESDLIILNSDGYKTFTTKERINHILNDNYTGYRLFQDDNIWYLYQIKPYTLSYKAPDKYKFQDNITLKRFINRDTNKLSWNIYNYAADNSAELKALKSKITRYVNAYWKDFIEGKVNIPNNEDCLACHFNIPGYDHLIMHMEESYYPGYLLYNAWHNYPYSRLSHDLIAAWINQDNDIFQDLIRIIGYQVKKSLYRYMIDKLIKSG